VKHLSWIIFFPLTIIIIVFLVVNRGIVVIDLWPLPIILHIPIFLLIVIPLLVGIILGGTGSWLSGGRYRRNIKKKVYEIETTSLENKRLKNKIEQLECFDERNASKSTSLNHISSVADRKDF